MADEESTIGVCPQCKKSFTGKSCPDCSKEAEIPTMIFKGKLFSDYLEKKHGPQPPPSGEEFKQGDLFHGLEILAIAGRGGMGAVYKARQVALDRQVALKILPADKADFVQLQDRFHREAKTLASLSHPNIVNIYDFGVEEGLYFFVMEFVDGMDLHDYLAQKQPGVEEIQKIFAQVCDALDYAHSKDVVHRDIKPANILIDREGRVKVADFGLAKFTQAGKGTLLTSTGEVMGTAHFMAPEQINDALHVDHRADLYSLGIMLYQMLTGEIPVGKALPPSNVSPAFAPFDPIIDRALESKPESRYQRASELKSDVDEASSGNTPLVRKKGRVLHHIAIVLVVLLVGGYFLYQKMGPNMIPSPIPPTPEVGSTPFEAFQAAIAYSSFTGMSSAEQAEVQRETVRLSPSERAQALLYLQKEISPLKEIWPEGEWLLRKKEAEHRLEYCTFLSGVLPAGDDLFDPVFTELDQVAMDLVRVLAWRGKIDLNIIPSPYAQIRGFKVGGEWWMVDGKRVGEGLESPVTISNIPIRSYKLVLAHPQKGEDEMEIPEGVLENGKVYAVFGKVGSLELGIAP